jgi:transposase, IS30 family
MRQGGPPAPRVVRERFWERVRSGLGVRDAGLAAGVSESKAWAWFKAAGGVKGLGAGPVSGRFLSVAEREEIAVGLAAGLSLTAIAARLGRAVSTVSREVARNSRGGEHYRAGAGGAAEGREAGGE